MPTITITNTGFQLCTSIISNGAITGNKWNSPNNLLLTDGRYTQSYVSAGAASDVIVGNFNAANVPTDAVITGIEIELINAYSGAPTSPSITITPYFVDNTSGENVYYPYVTPQVLTVTPTNYILGSSTYLFATSLTPDQINNAKIGLVANGNIYLDAVKISVYYYIPTVPTPPTPSGSVCVDCNSPIQVPDLYLALPFMAGDRYAYLQSFNYANGTPVNYADLGSCGGNLVFTFDPGLSQIGTGNFMENAKTAIWTVMTNGTVQLDFGEIVGPATTAPNRGLEFHTPYASDPNLVSNHDANSLVVLSDNAPMFGQYLQQCQIGALVSAPISVYKNGSNVNTPTQIFNFIGAGVNAVQNGSNPLQTDITIAGYQAQPAQIVNQLNFYSNTPATTYTSPSFTVTGTNRLLMVALTISSSVTVTAATWNSDSLTIVSTETNGAFQCVVLALVAPSLGAQTLDLTFSGATAVAGNMVAYTQVSQFSPYSSAVVATGTGILATLTPTTTTANATVFHAVSTAHFPILFTPGGGESIISQSNAGTYQGAIENQSVGTPATVTTNINMSVSTAWADIALGINGIQPAGTGIISINGDVTPIQNLVAGSGITIVDDMAGNHTFTATGSGGGSTPFSINQVAHGFAIGNIITPATDQWKKSIADTPADAEAWAQVTIVTDADNFTALPLVGTRQQDADIVALIAGFAGGDPLYVSAVTAGTFTNVAPSGGTTVTKPIGYVEADASGTPISLCTVNYRGQNNQVVPTGIFTNGATTKNTTDASGVQTIPHGLGTTPNNVRISGMGLGYSTIGGNTPMYSKSTYNGTTQSSLSQVQVVQTGPNNFISFVSSFIFSANGASFTATVCQQSGVITFDATNIYITWTKTGVNGTGIWDLMWEANA